MQGHAGFFYDKKNRPSPIGKHKQLKTYCNTLIYI